jgi:hypothetical protein
MRLKKWQDRARQRIELKVNPILSMALEPGEVVESSGHGIIFPIWWIALAGPLAAFLMRQYWVVLTDRNLIFVRLSNAGGPPWLEQLGPRRSFELLFDWSGVLGRRVTIGTGGKKLRLQFGTPYREHGEAIAKALRGPDTA